MTRVESMEQYYEIVKHAKEVYGRLYTNDHSFPAKMERYIHLGRLYYEDIGAGVMFFCDEESYYEALYHVNLEGDWKLSQKEKAVLVKNLYLKDKKNEKLLSAEKKLAEAGFLLKDRMGQISCDAEEVLKKIERSCQATRKIMDRAGFEMIPGDREILPQIREMQFTVAEIPYYQFPYFTDEELLEEIKRGHIICIVLNGELCAVRQFFREGAAVYGWVAVKEQYQRLYGLAIALSEYILRFAGENQVKVMGWVTDTNQKSIQYHTRLGYIWTGRYVDEWLLEA